MTPAAPTTRTPGLVRVTVTSSSRRVDLALPGMVAVAELLPELARSVGLLDPATAHGGYRALTSEGRRLEPELGLTPQGVPDGAVLALAAGVDDPPPVVHDDLAEAVGDLSARDLPAWGPVAARRATVAAGAVVLGLAGLALALLDERSSAGTVAAVGAVLLLVAAVVASRVRGEQGPAVTLAWLATGYAAVAGHLLAGSPDPAAAGYLGEPAVRTVATGGGAALAGLAGLLALDRGRVLLAPALVAGAAYALAGIVALTDPGTGTGTGVGAGTGEAVRTTAVALVVLLVVAVLAATVLPWVALASTTQTDLADLASPAARGGDTGGRLDVVPPVDLEQVAADVRLAHELLLAVAATAGLLLVVVAPAAVGLGPAGALLAVDACAVVALRSRRSRSRTEVLTGLAAGVSGLVVVVLAVLVTHESWRASVAVVGLALGVVVLGSALTTRPGSRSTATALRRARLTDAVETTALVALLPLLAWASGLLGAVGSAAGRL